ncbi:MAG: response regulator [Chloroflexi bacterium]|nr:response regulator [Chloroflexota bacterium]
MTLRSLQHDKQNQLSRRLLLYVVLCSTLFTLLATATQLYIGYRQDLRAIETNLQFIADSYVPGISASVYMINETQLSLQLQGALNLRDIEYLEIVETRGEEQIHISVGDPNTPRDIVRAFPLEYPASGSGTSYGTLIAVASLQGVYQRLSGSALVALTTSLLSIFLVALSILLISQFTLTRHLIKIADFTQELDLDRLERELILNRGSEKLLRPDELDQVVSAINDTRVRLKEGIDERERLQKQLRQQERMAAVGQLAAGIAHDFNNLLTTIMLYAQIGLRKPNLTSDLSQGFKTILDESKKAAELVQQILDFSRRSMIEFQTLEMQPLLDDALGILRRTIPENIQLVMEMSPKDFSLTVEADPTRIHQVVTNLATNARDAMSEGGELRFSLSKIETKLGEEPPVPDMSPREWACLTVSDSGTGMTEEAQVHLFEPFFTTKEPGKGTGLGLAQVYGIIRQHQGYIGMETKEGEGTTFHIYLPASKAEAEVVSEDISITPQGQGEAILLVEDNERLREVGHSLLESLGYQVLDAENGIKALDLYKTEGDVDVVITDLVMPEMGGKELVQELRKLNPDIKALAITGYIVEKDARKLREGGFLDVVYKPFDVKTLAQVVHRALSED